MVPSSSRSINSASLYRRQRASEAEIASEIYSTAGDYDLSGKILLEKDTDWHFVNEQVQVIPHPGHHTSSPQGVRQR